MEYGELYLPLETPNHNPTNGRFLKGHTPHNKGKKWSDYMGKRAQKRASKGWANLEKRHAGGHTTEGGLPKKPVIAVTGDGRFFYFESVRDVQKKTGYCDKAVGRCCIANKSRSVNKRNGTINTDHKYKGIRFYYESDNIWMEKIKQT